MSSSFDIAVVLFLFALGAVLGSFGNVLILRLPQGHSIAGRSKCPQCGKVLSPLELIPILSFIFLRGRCSKCKSMISWQYPIVEFGAGILFAFALFHAVYVPGVLLLSLTLWFLLLAAVTDARSGGIPDAFSIPFVIFAIAYSAVMGSFSIIPILLGIGFFALQWILSRGKWVGTGDIILGAGMGALLGSWEMLAIALWFAYVLGASVAIALLLTKKKTHKEWIPFGPFLACGTMMALSVGDRILGLFLF